MIRVTADERKAILSKVPKAHTRTTKHGKIFIEEAVQVMRILSQLRRGGSTNVSRRLWWFYSSDKPKPVDPKNADKKKESEQKPGSDNDNSNQEKT